MAKTKKYSSIEEAQKKADEINLEYQDNRMCPLTKEICYTSKCMAWRKAEIYNYHGFKDNLGVTDPGCTSPIINGIILVEGSIVVA